MKLLYVVASPIYKPIRLEYVVASIVFGKLSSYFQAIYMSFHSTLVEVVRIYSNVKYGLLKFGTLDNASLVDKY